MIFAYAAALHSDSLLSLHEDQMHKQTKAQTLSVYEDCAVRTIHLKEKTNRKLSWQLQQYS